jgi:hypothetical protein
MTWCCANYEESSCRMLNALLVNLNKALFINLENKRKWGLSSPCKEGCWLDRKAGVNTEPKQRPVSSVRRTAPNRPHRHGCWVMWDGNGLRTVLNGPAQPADAIETVEGQTWGTNPPIIITRENQKGSLVSSASSRHVIPMHYWKDKTHDRFTMMTQEGACNKYRYLYILW